MLSLSWNPFCFGTAMVTSQILFCLVISIKVDNLKADRIALIAGASLEVVYKPQELKSLRAFGLNTRRVAMASS
jgi:hypothetical protein